MLFLDIIFFMFLVLGGYKAFWILGLGVLVKLEIILVIISSSISSVSVLLRAPQ